MVVGEKTRDSGAENAPGVITKRPVTHSVDGVHLSISGV
jgi:hypothetical protein